MLGKPGNFSSIPGTYTRVGRLNSIKLSSEHMCYDTCKSCDTHPHIAHVHSIILKFLASKSTTLPFPSKKVNTIILMILNRGPSKVVSSFPTSPVHLNPSHLIQSSCFKHTSHLLTQTPDPNSILLSVPPPRSPTEWQLN